MFSTLHPLHSFVPPSPVFQAALGGELPAKQDTRQVDGEPAVSLGPWPLLRAPHRPFPCEAFLLLPRTAGPS